jgi:hypothetical protein
MAERFLTGLAKYNPKAVAATTAAKGSTPLPAAYPGEPRLA